jgi:hypothetical protein
MRLVADLRTRRRDRVGARRQRPSQGAQPLGIERHWEFLDEVNELPADDPALRRAGIEQLLDVALAEARIGLQRLQRERGDVRGS